jgi:hypothetical protein
LLRDFKGEKMQEKSRVDIAIILSFIFVAAAVIIWASQTGKISINADIAGSSPQLSLSSSYCENGMQVNEFTWTNSSFTPYTLFVRGTDKGFGIDQITTTDTTVKWNDKATCYNGVEKCYQSNSTLYFDLLAGNTVNQNSYVWGTCSGTSCVSTCPICPIAHSGIAVPKIDCSQSSSPTPNSSASTKSCFKEGESLGAVIPENADNVCCDGLIAVIPNGVVGTMGTCQKTSSTSSSSVSSTNTTQNTIDSATQSITATNATASSASKPNVITLVSTGKSLWFNLVIAFILATVVSYLFLRRRKDY